MKSLHPRWDEKKKPTTLLSILIITHLPALKGSLFSQMKSLNLECLSRICSEALFLKHSLGLPSSSVGIFEPTLQKGCLTFLILARGHSQRFEGSVKGPDGLSALDLLRICVIAAIFLRPEIKHPGLKWLRLMRRINTPDETSYSLRCVNPLHTLSDWQICTVARKGRDEGFPGT